MKAISIRNPWAGYIKEYKKTIEVRTMATHYRGDLLICTSKKPKSKNSGNAVAVVELYDCRPLMNDDLPATCIGYLTPVEIYRSWAWCLRNIRKIEPFPVKGQQGLFEVDDIHICEKCQRICMKHELIVEEYYKGSGTNLQILRKRLCQSCFRKG